MILSVRPMNRAAKAETADIKPRFLLDLTNRRINEAFARLDMPTGERNAPPALDSLLNKNLSALFIFNHNHVGQLNRGLTDVFFAFNHITEPPEIFYHSFVRFSTAVCLEANGEM